MVGGPRQWHAKLLPLDHSINVNSLSLISCCLGLPSLRLAGQVCVTDIQPYGEEYQCLHKSSPYTTSIHWWVSIAGTSSTAKKSVTECCLFCSYIIPIHCHYNGCNLNFYWKNMKFHTKVWGSLNLVCLFLRIRSRGIALQYSLIYISIRYRTLKDNNKKRLLITLFLFLFICSFMCSTCEWSCIITFFSCPWVTPWLALGWK
jgi:hypothetical protein